MAASCCFLSLHVMSHSSSMVASTAWSASVCFPPTAKLSPHHFFSPSSSALVFSPTFPYLLAGVLNHFSPTPADGGEHRRLTVWGFDLTGHGALAAVGLLFNEYLYTFLDHQFNIMTDVLGMTARVAACSLVYRKVGTGAAMG
uniref:Uncharacterized protein n=1 Tax=Cacopsylla melanoneura TaxID=428564 RepID=A0A8D8TJI1_9HEMI